MSETLSARYALLADGIRRDVAVCVEGGVISEVRPWRSSDPPLARGLLIPGLVNAHTHLELSWASGLVPGGEGLARWVGALMALPRPQPAQPANAAPLALSGTALVCDISNGASTAEAIDAAGLYGIVQHELLGMAPSRLPALLQAAAASERQVGRVYVRPSPHAVYSTPRALICAAARAGRHPASIHLAEDPDEERFVSEGAGSFAELLDRIGIGRGVFDPVGLSPARYLDQLGALSAGLLCVHGVHLSRDDMALLASRGAPLALCPRSNLHIGGRLPDVPALLAAGVALCLGTDSLASAPSLDVLEEIPVLARAYPQIPVERWLLLATSGGAEALGFPSLGKLSPGLSPGIVLLALSEPDDLREGVPKRQILEAPR